MKEILLTDWNYKALVDDEDYDFLMQWKWGVKISKDTQYAMRRMSLAPEKVVLPFTWLD
jgi:hypothetical protein